MHITKDVMASETITCERCGKQIFPSDAAYKGVESLGRAPRCEACSREERPGHEKKKKADTDGVVRLELPPQHPDFNPPPTVHVQRASGLDNKFFLWVLLLGAGVCAGWMLMRGPEDSPKLASGEKEQPHPQLIQPEQGDSGQRKKQTSNGSGDDKNQLDAGGDEWSSSLTEVETVVRLTGDNPDWPTALRAMKRLHLIAQAGEGKAKVSAGNYWEHYRKTVEAHIRQKMRDDVQVALDVAAEGKYSEAMSALQKTEKWLPTGVPWVESHGRKTLQRVRGAIRDLKSRQLRQARSRLDTLVKQGQLAQARAYARTFENHVEEEFRLWSRTVVKDIQSVEKKQHEVRLKQEEKARIAWPLFFEAFDKAIASSGFDKAQALCRPKENSPLLWGSQDPKAVLEGFEAEAIGVKEMYAAVIKAAQTPGVQAAFGLPRLVGKGQLTGVRKKSLVFQMQSAELLIALERLRLKELGALLSPGIEWNKSPYAEALWMLSVARKQGAKNEVAKVLVSRYRAQNKKLPFHWSQRFAQQRNKELKEQAYRMLKNLQDALTKNQIPEVRKALAALKPLRDGGVESLLADADRALLVKAQMLVGTLKIKHAVLQNGNLPAADFDGIRIDQINKYYKNVKRTDVGVHEGLKLGSYNDLQRILIRFDSLQAVIGKGRIRKATLEFYQIKSPKAQGAEIGLFPLKRLWKPDAGSWLNADQRRKKRWEKPGASGESDAAGVAVATRTLTGPMGGWRSWDVTTYVRAVLVDKTKDFGLLVRVTRNEPLFDVRFYPDGDLAGKRQPELRPRLIIEYEVSELKK